MTFHLRLVIPEIEKKKYSKVLVEVNETLCSVLAGKYSYEVKLARQVFFILNLVQSKHF